MPHYVRAFQPGGTFFFTVVTNYREPLFNSALARRILGDAFRSVFAERPVESIGIVLLPDHIHCVWELPDGDSGYPMRWKMIKERFTKAWRNVGGKETGRSESRIRRGERGIWQRRYWEHTVKDEEELGRLVDYIHYNPVKHGHTRCPHEWAHSTFAQYVGKGTYPENWGCLCGDGTEVPPWCVDVGPIVGE